MDKFLSENLNELKSKGFYNQIDTLKSSNGTIIALNSKNLINLSSNNYLGLATDERFEKTS